jgi:endoglucanase
MLGRRCAAFLKFLLLLELAVNLSFRFRRIGFPFFLTLTAMLIAVGAIAAANAQGAGYWHTSGAQIYDSNNQPVRIAGINWYGFETTDMVAHGLSSQDYKSILQTIKTQGYNTIRIPFSNQMVETPGTNLNITYWSNFGPANTDLQGLNSLQVLDHIINYAGTIGLKIILDNHRSEAGNSAESNGLWYTGQYPESNWIADWQALATRYAGNPTVIGMDLRNEPHNAYSGGACWDCGGANDWHLAAARGGNAVLAVNPSLLIFVEGTDAYNNDYYWWGGNLEGVANSPVTLSVANRLVYSAHDYGPNEYGQSWFNGNTTPASLNAVWTQHWAYISQQGTAPVWLGEFGTENSDSDVQGSANGSQGQWFQSLTIFLKANPALNWTYWALNGEDNYGLLDSNYDPTPVDALKQSTLASIQFPLNTGSGGSATAPAAPSGLTATAASASQVNLSWTASTTSGVTYTVFFGTSAGSIGTVLTSGVAGTSYAATGLNASTAYYFTVEAVSSSGNSALSNTASATTQALPTTPAPGTPSAYAVSSSQINLSWLVNASGQTFTVYSGTSAAAVTNLVATGVQGTGYSVMGLSPNTTYYFTIVGYTATATSAPSGVGSATTLAPPPPAAPSGLTASAVSPSQINLTWAASSTAGVTYSVYSGATAGTATTLIASGIAGTSFASTGLAANTTYFYSVTAVLSGTGSTASNAASATTLAPVPPAAPSGLTATAVSTSQINLSWTASSSTGVTYTVYSGSSVVASGLSGTSYSVTGLAASTAYSYTVVAVSSTGTSTASNVASATTLTPTPPSAPTSLVATAVSSSQINLSWGASASSGVKYTVYSGSAVVASSLISTSYPVTGLTASTAYSYTVVAVSTNGTSTPSNVASATTLAATVAAPVAPFGLAASPGSASQVNLNWQPSTTSGVTYNVYIGTTSGATTTLAASGVPQQNYSVTGLLDGTAYYFTVKAVSSGGALSAASNQATATTQTLPSIPPTGLTATAVSATQIGLTWTAVPNTGATYAVYYGTSSGAENTMLATGVSGTSYQATGLSASTTYYFTVRAISGGGTSSPSQQASATTLSSGGGISPVIPPTTTAPTAPSGLVAVAASSTQINLTWTASTTAGVTYTVFIGSSPIASGLAGTSYAATGLTASTAYTFTVAAVNSAGTAASSPVTASTSAAPAPSAPTGLTATATSASQINLSWTASSTSGVTYTVLSGMSAGSEGTVVASGLSGTSYSASGLTASTAYYFVVKAVSGTALSTASNEASATTQAAAAGGCHVAYLDQNDWQAGFTGNLSITNNGSTAWTNWTVTWTYSGNQQIYQSWNGNYTQNGQQVSIANAAWNGSVAAGGTVAGIGWNANYSGTNTNPATFYVNGVQCK